MQLNLKVNIMKNAFYYLAVFAIIFVTGCANNPNNPGKDEVVETTISELLQDPDSYVNKQVKISGMVTHVCRHGGQKMFLTSGSDDEQVRITTGGDVDEFGISLEGTSIEITGLFRELRIDEAYIASLEKETEANHAGEHAEEGEADCSQENDEHQHEDENSGTSGQIARLRKQVEDSGKDYISDFWVENVSMKAVE